MRWLEPEITVPAATLPVSLTDLKRHLRLGAPGSEDQYTIEDPILQIALDASQAYVEQFTGLSLAERTIKLRAWGFDCLSFRLPAGPVSAVASITYLDTSGAEQTLSTDVYVASLYGLSPLIADLTITAASVLPGSGAVIQTGTAGEAVTAGQALYQKAADSKWYKADCNSATAEVRVAKAIALTGSAAGQPVVVQTGGQITIGATLTAGSPTTSPAPPAASARWPTTPPATIRSRSAWRSRPRSCSSTSARRRRRPLRPMPSPGQLRERVQFQQRTPDKNDDLRRAVGS
jgi:uncharacterized phiE125 gp8 family phage protein